MENYRGPIYHSSQLTGKSAKGKTMVVIGGGASAVEALEYAADEDAAKVYILARSDKWIIPRNPIVNMRKYNSCPSTVLICCGLECSKILHLKLQRE